VVVAYAGNPDDHPQRMMTGHARVDDRSSESLATWSPQGFAAGRCRRPAHTRPRRLSLAACRTCRSYTSETRRAGTLASRRDRDEYGRHLAAGGTRAGSRSGRSAYREPAHRGRRPHPRP
jgi:hypothetical protein